MHAGGGGLMGECPSGANGGEAGGGIAEETVGVKNGDGKEWDTQIMENC